MNASFMLSRAQHEQSSSISTTYTAARMQKRRCAYIFEVLGRCIIPWMGFSLTIFMSSCIEWDALFSACTGEKCGSIRLFLKHPSPRSSSWDAYVISYAVFIGLYLVWMTITDILRLIRVLLRINSIKRWSYINGGAESTSSLVAGYHGLSIERAIFELNFDDCRLAALDRRGIAVQACPFIDLRSTGVLEWVMRNVVLPACSSMNDVQPNTEAAIQTLQRRLIFVSICWAFFLIYLLPFTAIHAILRHAESVRSGAKETRCWAPRAIRYAALPDEWPHHTMSRLERFNSIASLFVDAKSGPSPTIQALAGTFAFAVGCALVLTTSIAVVEQDALLHLTSFGRPLVWWVFILTIFFKTLHFYSHPAPPVTESQKRMLFANLPGVSENEMIHLLPTRLNLYFKDVIAVILMPLVLSCGLYNNSRRILEATTAVSTIEAGISNGDDPLIMATLTRPHKSAPKSSILNKSSNHDGFDEEIESLLSNI